MALQEREVYEMLTRVCVLTDEISIQALQWAQVVMATLPDRSPERARLQHEVNALRTLVKRTNELKKACEQKASAGLIA